MSERRNGRPRSGRRSAPYAPALDYRAAGGDDPAGVEGPEEDGPRLYPDYTGLAQQGLSGPVAAVGTESQPTGVRVLPGPPASPPEHLAPADTPPPTSPAPASPVEGEPPQRRGNRRRAVPPQPPPQPPPSSSGFRVSPAVRIIAPGAEAAPPTTRASSERARAGRRAQLPAIPAPQRVPQPVPQPDDPPVPPKKPGVAHTATPGRPAVAPRPAPGLVPPTEQAQRPAEQALRPAEQALRPAGLGSPDTAEGRRPPPGAGLPRRSPPPPVGPSRPPAAPPPAASPPAAPPSPTRLSASPVVDEERRSFSRNTSLMAAGTLIARLTGFGKVLALAWVLGSGRLADAFNLANNLPNSLYDLLLGGVLSATLIPVFVDELRKENRRDGTRAISAVVTSIVALLALMTVLFWLITPAIIDLLLVNAAGKGVSQERHTAVQLLHLFVPQLPLLGAIAVSTALLNARRRFVAPAFSPILCNLVTIGAVIATKYVARQVSLSDFQTDTTAVLVLGLGTTAGYLVQFLAQVPSVLRAGIRVRPVWNPGHPAVRTVLRLSVWTFGAVVTNQISFYVIQLLAVSKPGSVSSFNYAYQFFQLPYAIFAVSIASVIAPDLAQKWSNGMRRAFRARMGSGIRLTLAILMPAGVGYAIVAQPLLRLALHHGRYSEAQTHLTGVLVAIFALGLPGFSVYLLLMRAYQSMKNTRSMFWCYCVENGLTVVVGVSLYQVWGVRGLVVGWVGAYSVVALFAFAHLSARAGGLQGPAVLVTALRVALATAVMAAVLEGLTHVLPTSEQWGFLAVRVGVLTVAGSLVYVLVALWLGVTEVRQVLLRGGGSDR